MMMAVVLFLLSLLSTTAYGQGSKPDTSDLRYADFHLAFVTPLSTNGLQSGQTVNRVSLNMLFGYSAGLDGFEAGSFINMESRFVKGLQLAGFANVNTGWTKGAQVSGFTNVSTASTEGLQAAGFANVNAKGVKGAQLSGFLNYADDLRGLQASGFLNVADRVRGTQLGFLNVADTFAQGIPVGFLSFVKDGYNRVEAWGSGAFHANLTGKFGVPEFYNMVSVGREFSSSEELWGIGYGVGTQIPFTPKAGMNIDLLSYDLNIGNDMLGDETAMLNTLKLNANYDIGAFEVFAGPSLNLLVTDKALNQRDNQQPISELLGPSPLTESTSDGVLYEGWIGASVGIRY